MAKIIDLQERKDAKTPHLSGEARCIACGHTWAAVAPVGTVNLECPACHLMKGAFIWPAWRAGADHWQCRCGNILFILTRDGFYCPNCGEWQTGF